MSINLGAEGDASVRLILGGLSEDRAALLRTGNAVVAALFPVASRRSTTINSNSGGYPFVELHAADVYRRGAHPVVTIDTKPALAVLTEMGYSNVDVDIDAGGVPSSATWAITPASTYPHSWSWPGLGPGNPGPSGTIRLNPRPWQGFAVVALEVATLAALVLAVFGSRRRGRLLTGAAALVAAAAEAIEIASAGAVQPDNLGVSGLAGSAQLSIIRWTLIPCFAATVAAIILFLTTVERTKPAVPIPQFNAPPGWPTPPAGWMPMPGWQPDRTWPPAPPGWAFNVKPYEPPPRSRSRLALLAARGASRLRRSRRPGGQTPSL